MRSGVVLAGRHRTTTSGVVMTWCFHVSRKIRVILAPGVAFAGGYLSLRFGRGENQLCATGDTGEACDPQGNGKGENRFSDWERGAHV